MSRLNDSGASDGGEGMYGGFGWPAFRRNGFGFAETFDPGFRIAKSNLAAFPITAHREIPPPIASAILPQLNPADHNSLSC